MFSRGSILHFLQVATFPYSVVLASKELFLFSVLQHILNSVTLKHEYASVEIKFFLLVLGSGKARALKLLLLLVGMHRNFGRWKLSAKYGIFRKKAEYMSPKYILLQPSVFSTQVSLSCSIFLKLCEQPRSRRCTT